MSSNQKIYDVYISGSFEPYVASSIQVLDENGESFKKIKANSDDSSIVNSLGEVVESKIDEGDGKFYFTKGVPLNFGNSAVLEIEQRGLDGKSVTIEIDPMKFYSEESPLDCTNGSKCVLMTVHSINFKQMDELGRMKIGSFIWSEREDLNEEDIMPTINSFMGVHFFFDIMRTFVGEHTLGELIGEYEEAHEQENKAVSEEYVGELYVYNSRGNPLRKIISANTMNTILIDKAFFKQTEEMIELGDNITIYYSIPSNAFPSSFGLALNKFGLVASLKEFWSFIESNNILKSLKNILQLTFRIETGEISALVKNGQEKISIESFISMVEEFGLDHVNVNDISIGVEISIKKSRNMIDLIEFANELSTEIPDGLAVFVKTKSHSLFFVGSELVVWEKQSQKIK